VARRLTKSEIKKLAQLGVKIETFYACIRISNGHGSRNRSTGKFFILQARPITALPRPLKVSGAMRMIVPMLAEMWPCVPIAGRDDFYGAVERSIGNLLTA